MTISGGSAGDWDYTEETPVSQWAVFVNNSNAYYNNIAYTYSGTLTQWIQFAGSINVTFDDNFTLVSNVVSIAANAISYDEMQKVTADERILGNITGASQDVQELTPTQVRTMINVEDGAEVNAPVGWHGSATRIKILPTDFRGYGDRDQLQILGNGAYAEDPDGKLTTVAANYPIPTGFKATAVMMYSNINNAFTVYENEINDGSTATSKGSGNANTEVNITDVTSTTTNYLTVVYTEGNDELQGGYITIEAV